MKTTPRHFDTKRLTLTDGGLETDLLFNKGFDLPEFASFPLLETEKGTKALLDYYREFLELAREKDMDFLLESPSWRANPNWGNNMGYSRKDLEKANSRCISVMKGLREEYAELIEKIHVSGCVGPSGDGYQIQDAMTVDQSYAYHFWQVQVLVENGVDLISALTMTNSAEATGIVLAAQKFQVPVIVSFTVETDGRLPSGETLEEAISTVDHNSGSYPEFYMINCAHPTHFIELLETDATWIRRIGGLRANASCKSHEELDNSEELDRGNPEQLSAYYKTIREILPELKLFGGCCGTDIEHLRLIASKLSPAIEV